MADIPVRVIIDAINNASKQFDEVGNSLEDLGGKMRTVGAAGAAIGGITVALAKGFIEQAGAMEQNQVAFETMLGSADKAKTLLMQMNEFAAKTPFQLPDVVNAGKQLLAYGFQQEKVIDTTRMLGDVAAGLNIPLGDIIYLFGTLRAQGRAYTKDLNQFTARGIPILDLLAKQYHTTTAAVFDLAAEGKIGFEDINKAFQTMTGSGGQFFNLMDKQSKTTLGTWSNLQDSLTRVQITLGEALLPAVNQLMDAIMPMITAFGAWAKEHPELIKNMIIAGLVIGALGAALLLIGAIIPPIVAGISLLIGAVSGIATFIGGAIGVIGTIVGVLGGPLTLIILAVIAVITLLTLAWKNNWGDIQGKTRAAIDWIKGAFNNFITTIKNIIQWVKNVGEAFSALGKYFAAIAVDGDYANDWLTHLPEAIQGVVQAVGKFVADTGAFFQALPAQLVAVGQSIVDFFNSLPGMIANALVATGQALYKFFTNDLPFAIGFAVGQMVKFFTVDIPAAWNALVIFFTQTVPLFFVQLGTWFVEGITQLTITVWDFFTVTVPNAIISLINWLAVAIPAMWQAVVSWTINAGIAIGNAISNFVTQAIAFFINLWNNLVATAIRIYNDVVKWFSQTKDDSITAIQNIPNEVSRIFESAKQAAISKAQEIYDGVKGWFDKVIGFFKDIVDWAGKAISKAGEAATAGFNAGKRQFGGPVSLASPVLVGEAGPELFVPQVAGNIIPNHQLGGGRGGSTIQFIVNTNMVINSPTERRSLAEALYKDLVTLARSQNMTVAELMGA